MTTAFPLNLLNSRDALIAERFSEVLKTTLHNISELLIESGLAEYTTLLNELNSIAMEQSRLTLQSVIQPFADVAPLPTCVEKRLSSVVCKVDKRSTQYIQFQQNNVPYNNVELCILLTDEELKFLSFGNIQGSDIQELFQLWKRQQSMSNQMGLFVGHVIQYMGKCGSNSGYSQEAIETATELLTDSMLKAFVNNDSMIELRTMFYTCINNYDYYYNTLYNISAYTLYGDNIVNSAQLSLLNAVGISVFTDYDINNTNIDIGTHVYASSHNNINTPTKSKQALSVIEVHEFTIKHIILKPIIEKLLSVFDGPPHGVINNDGDSVLVFHCVVRIKVMKNQSIVIAVLKTPNILHIPDNKNNINITSLTHQGKDMHAVIVNNNQDVIDILAAFNFECLLNA